MNKIEGFFDRYRFLSNFVDAVVKYDGEIYPTTEHAYQAAKTRDLEARKKIQAAATPGTAKKLGKSVEKREDWDSVKEIVMTYLLVQKFSLPEYRNLLLATGDAYLEETNFWGDTYWGVCGGVGQNRLGHILMDIRSILREEDSMHGA